MTTHPLSRSRPVLIVLSLAALALQGATAMAADRVTGKLDNVQIAAMSPSDVGKGLLDLMGRTLNVPFKLVEEAASLATGNTAKKTKTPEAAAPPPSD